MRQQTMHLLGKTTCFLLACMCGLAQAQDLLITNARIHTALADAPIANGQVLILDGRISQVGDSVSAPNDIRRFDAQGRNLTPGLFGGVAPLGLVEVSLEETTVEYGLNLGDKPNQFPAMRPEFDPVLAYNPHTSAVAVNRIEGISFALLGANSGGSIIAGQGQLARFDGSFTPALSGSETLFTQLGAGAHDLAGNSRAGQYMLLEQAFREARSKSKALVGESRLLTITGREVLARYLDGGRLLVNVSRAADILQVIRLAEKHGFKPVIHGGTEAWMVAEQLAAANVPVLLNPLENLPGNFDRIGARLDNAKLLQDAGVRIAFTLGGDAHNTRKIRQAAGNAVANGLAWADALQAITSNPAQIFAQEDEVGSIASGRIADLVLWSGDPLEVTSVAEAIWHAGQLVPLTSRQTKLRDRYLPRETNMPRQYLKP